MSHFDNEPAFPFVWTQLNAFGEQVTLTHHGMSLRDWFAGQALNAHLSNPDHWPMMANGQVTKADIASSSYEFADAMLAERVKGGT
jgi:hypothetical protein